jgi:hypothetical protein
MRLQLVTQNVGTEHNKAISITITPSDNPDVIVVCRQEVDDKYVFNSDKNNIVISNTFIHKHTESLNISSKKSHQNIKIDVYTKNNMNLQIKGDNMKLAPLNNRKGVALLKYQSSGLGKGYSKGAVWVSFMGILIINLHLPIDTHQSDYGLKYRKDSLFKILNKLDNVIVKSKYVFELIEILTASYKDSMQNILDE